MSIGHSQRLARRIEHSRQTLARLLGDAAFADTFDAAAGALVETMQNGGRLYLAGNGGSAADAMHIAAEFVVRLRDVRPGLPAEALSGDPAILTAIGNDFGFEEIFARQLEAKMCATDLLLAISTSGTSPNIVRGLQVCRRMGATSLLLTGSRADTSLADHTLAVPDDDACAVQEIHRLLGHTLCECVEQALFGAGESR